MPTDKSETELKRYKKIVRDKVTIPRIVITENVLSPKFRNLDISDRFMKESPKG